MRPAGLAILGVATMALACSTFSEDSTKDGGTSVPSTTSCNGNTATSLCDDFEGRASVLGPGWTDAPQGSPGSIVLSTEQAKSPSNSLLVTVADNATNYADAVLQKRFPPNTQSLTCSFSIWLDRLVPSPGIGDPGVIRIRGVSNTSSLFKDFTASVSVGPSNTSLFTKATAPNDSLLKNNSVTGGALPLRTWVRARFEALLETQTVTFYADDALVVSETLPAAFVVSNGIDLSFGVISARAPARYFLDDLACQSK